MTEDQEGLKIYAGGDGLDWNEIKTEYITSNASYRDLCEKYGVGIGKLGKIAGREGWKQLRDKHRDELVTKAIQKNEDHILSRLDRIQSLADRLTDKVSIAIEQIDSRGEVDRVGLRQITAAMRDIMEIQGIRTELDREEQQARIESLRAQTARSGAGLPDETETGVVLIPPVEKEAEQA